ncbi:imelysin family protein [Arcticibacterium luteifluviistationis]|uniref:Iron-regulated protein n=1 Tax=Arcticibacterium luteifluviistationis TaxID=1784714 RepID=A0A2Z4G947_9BACT|nr:imelysin family protein [Arcticibacterium luteifluviistationis]AWV97757.1 iron-regulated protein [Arcticibacterium luteifluviistationis]
MKKLILSTFILFAAFACDDNNETPTPAIDVQQEVLDQYAAMVYANYDDAVQTALTLQTAVDAFIADPSDATLETAKAAWIASRNPYGQTEAFRFYGGPIDDENGPEGLINGWPLDESYIDYVEGNTESGIINDPVNFATIDKAALMDANENGGETNLSTGYHAIEFLLWGQDFNDNGPGTRPFTDYTTATNADRRATYLSVVTALLIENLTEVRDAWAAGATYTTSFLAGGETSLANVLRGIGALSKGELAGERMTVALENGDQEDEHSCFSDNTKADIAMNFKGIDNVYKGIYTSSTGIVTSGTSLSDLLGAASAAKNQTVLDLLSQSSTNIDGIPAPFDSALRAGDPNGNIESSIISLRNLSDAIVDAALEIGIQVNAELD